MSHACWLQWHFGASAVRCRRDVTIWYLVRQQLADTHTAPPNPALDAPVQAEEVNTAVAQLHNGKAASPNDQVSGELLKKSGEAGRCRRCGRCSIRAT